MNKKNLIKQMEEACPYPADIFLDYKTPKEREEVIAWLKKGGFNPITLYSCWSRDAWKIFIEKLMEVLEESDEKDVCSGCCMRKDIVLVNPSGSFCQDCVDDKQHLI